MIKWLDEVALEDVPLVGGKNASLGEMIRSLSGRGIRVPGGFCVTAEGYRHFLRKAGIDARIKELLASLRPGDIEGLARTGEKIRHTILDAEIPADLREAIRAAYARLAEIHRGDPDVAVRSSATAEDLPSASFAGQQETFLNVKGSGALLEAIKRCFASLFTDRAISYRHDQGFDHTQVAISVGVQKMIRSDLAGAGVMFTIDTESGFREAILINASFGLGETVVKGTVNPDEYCVFKPKLKEGFRPLLRRRLGSKDTKLVYDLHGTKGTKLVPTDLRERETFVLSDDEILSLSRWGLEIESHYGRPMDIEWAKDGITGELFIVQARPETVLSSRHSPELRIYSLKKKGELVVSGKSIGDRIGAGKARLVGSPKDLPSFRKGEVLVAEMTDPDWEPVMRLASAIVTNKGGRTCHAAIVARELGIPAVVGTDRATAVIASGDPVTVSCAEGDAGHVYRGILPFEINRFDPAGITRPSRTKVMINVGNPDLAFGLSFLPNDGVGLAREEFIISSSIRIHPQALTRFDRITDEPTRAEIEKLTAGYADKKEFFTDRLSQGIATIAAAFWPKDVILRFSDFKTNEYASLIGGAPFEPREANPMMGWRGASRYYTDYSDGFALECAAIRRVREGMGLANLKLLVPMVRTLEEGRRVIAEMRRHGLVQGKDGLEVYVMCEVPSNALLAEEFLEIFDGFSIGSNDLTQFTLAVDRDSERLSSLFDEDNPAVKKLIEMAVRAALKKGKKIGICGQAPSDKPGFAEFLVGLGISSISLNPDSVIKTLARIAALP